MIGYLRGTLCEKNTGMVVVDVAGLGYEVFIPLTSFDKLPALNQSVLLYAHMVVREDAHTLYGFHDKLHRDLFRLLIRVNGVGPKLALTILSGMNASELMTCVMNEDVVRLTQLPGIGKKTATRLMLEIRDPLQQFDTQNVAAITSTQGSMTTAHADAVQALMGLGYKSQDAMRMIASLRLKEATSEQLIREALKSVVH